MTDRGRSDDAQGFDQVDQQKRLAHILRSLHDVVGRKRGGAWEFGASLKIVLQDALALWHRHREEPVADFKIEAEALQAELTYQRRDRRLKDPDNQRLLNALGWHHDRGYPLRFSVEPRIEPTNNRAEVRSVDQKPSVTLGGLVLKRTGGKACQLENSRRVSVQFRSPLVRG